MAKNNVFETLPVAPLQVAALSSCSELGKKVDEHIVCFRKNDLAVLAEAGDTTRAIRGYNKDTYLVDCCCPRFSSGEAKGMINTSVRGSDLFVMADVTNHSITYNMGGYENHMSPDDHFADLKRIVSIAESSAHRVNVILPFLYESRQHKKSRRESLDSAFALQELVNMGIDSIVTFDAHDPRVQNAIPLFEFDNFMPTYQFVKALFKASPDLKITKDKVMVVSPDEGAMNRAVYLANNIGVDVGMFYKRRDYSTIINGRNPIVAHEFLGSDVAGKTVIIIDDMIASGESMMDTCHELKDRKAANVIVLCTFGLFTSGFEKFDEFYNKGYLDKVITTNLNYRPAELFTKPWYVEADMSDFLASIINTMNHDSSMSELMNPTKKIQKYIRNFNEGRRDFQD